MFRRSSSQPTSGTQNVSNQQTSPTLSSPPTPNTELPLRTMTQANPLATPAQTQATAPSMQARPMAAPQGMGQQQPINKGAVDRFVGIPGVTARRIGMPTDAGMGHNSSSQYADHSGLRKLTVGREITLNGDISTCDVLVVEGNINATLSDGKILEISQDGFFNGSAEIEEADIGGKFEGTLVVRGRLRLRSTGNISGTVSYGELEVEAGGHLVGELKVLNATKKTTSKADGSDSSSPARALASAEG